MPNMSPIRIVIAGVDKFSNKFAKVNKTLMRTSKRMDKMGGAMTRGVTLPVAAAGFTIIRAAVKFDAAMNKVQAKAVISGKSLIDLRNQAKKMGTETTFSATQAAEAQQFLAQAGFNTGQIYTALPAVLDLAAASEMDLGRAADITSNIMGAFGLQAKDTAKIANILAVTTASANVDMEMLGETMKYAAPHAKRFKMSLENTAAIAGFLGNIGIQGSMAGTAVKSMMEGLTKGTKSARMGFKSLGVDVANFKGEPQEITKIIAQMSKGMTKLSTIDQSRALSELFGLRGAGPMGALSDDIAKTNSGFLKLSKSLNSLEGDEVKKMAQIMNQGAVGGLKAFTSALEGVAIAIGESGILDMVSKFTRKLAGMLRGFSKISPVILKTGFLFIGLLATVGPLLIIGAKLIAVIASITAAVGKAGGVIALLSNPIGWVILAITALIAIVTVMTKNFDNNIGKVMTLIFPLGGIVAWIITRWSKIVPFFKLFGLIIGKIFSKIKAGPVGTVIQWLGDKLGWIGNLLQRVLDFGLNALTKIAGKIVGPELMAEAGFEGYKKEPGAVVAEKVAEKAAVGKTLNESRIKLDMGNLPAGTTVTKEGGANVDLVSDNGAYMTGTGM